MALIMIIGSWAYAADIIVEDTNYFTINGISFRLNLVGEKRVGDYAQSPLNFTVSQQTYRDSTVILYSATEADIRLTIDPVERYSVPAWKFNVGAEFKAETYLHQLYFEMEFASPYSMVYYKGVDAIEAQDTTLNSNLVPYTDKVIEHRLYDKSFWIAASNFAECRGVEGLTNTTINLYDNKLHFFRQFRPSTNMADLPRDTMYKNAGSSESWSFLVFTDKPLLAKISRWPADKLAALAISNDADGEWPTRLSAIYFGSDNPANPKYMREGLIANNIKVSNTVFGTNQAMMSAIWDTLYNHGNSIGYHTFTGYQDSLGVNEQALLHDLVPYNIRLWIDHSISYNPEDFGWNGLNPDSPQYIGDVINQSNIVYAWMADTPPNNPFDCFEEPWRLPHRLYELTALEHPVWFFGRTRMNAWENLNGDIQIDFKNTMTPDNLDRLLQNHGLHISYTHFCFSNVSYLNSYYIINPTGDHEIRPEVEDMLEMLDYYQTYRGLWIETVENIFDRMLATEELRVTGINPAQTAGTYEVRIINDSEYPLDNVRMMIAGEDIISPRIAAGETVEIPVDLRPDPVVEVVKPFTVRYASENFYLTAKEGFVPQKGTISLYNFRGQLCHTYRDVMIQHKTMLPVSGLNSGIYFLKVAPGAGETQILKTVVVN